MTAPPSKSSLPPAFQRLALSNLAAHSAQQVGMAAAPIFAVTVLNASVGESASIQLAQVLPFLLFSIPAGVLADRMRRRELMRLGEFVRALSLAAVPLIALAGHLNVAILALLGFLGSVGSVAYSVAVPTLTNGLVPRSLLATANSRLELARSVAFIGGPALAGALVAWIGESPAFGIATTLSIAAIHLLGGLPEPVRSAPQKHHFIEELADGARFVVAHPLMRPAFGVTVIYNASFFMLQTTFMPYAAQQLGMNAAGIGTALAFYGVGLVLAGLMAPALARRLSVGIMLAVGPIFGVVAALCMLVTLWLSAPWLPGLCFFLLGSGPTLWGISYTTLRQHATPPELMGRVASITSLATYGARPLGAAMAGLLGSAFGLHACIWTVSVGFVLQLGMLFQSPLPRLEHYGTPLPTNTSVS